MLRSSVHTLLLLVEVYSGVHNPAIFLQSWKCELFSCNYFPAKETTTRGLAPQYWLGCISSS